MSRENDPVTQKLSSVLKDILEVRQSLMAAGAPAAKIAQTTGEMLQERWPPMGRPWRYVCDTCSDTGWALGICTSRTPCGRPFRFPGAHSDDKTGQGRCSSGHDYVWPCPSCARGRQRQSDLMQAARSDDHSAAGKTPPKSKGFTRWNG